MRSPLHSTGYVHIKEANRALLGDEIIDQIGEVYGLDSEGELRASYRPSGHPGVSFFHVPLFFGFFVATEPCARVR